MNYEYEMFFNDTSPVSIHGWYPIATDRIKDQSRIQEYIDKGILRKIDMKEQNSAHGFTEGSEVPKEQSYDNTQKLNEAITIIQLLLPMAERGRLPELKQTDEYILNRVKKFLK